MLVHVLREYSLNKIFLSSLGLWPFQSKLTRNLLPILCLVLEISYYPFELLMLYDHRDDARMIFESCYQLVLTSTFIARLWNGIFNHHKVRLLYEAMNDHWNIFVSDSEIRILKDYSVISRKFTIFHSIMMYFMMMTFIIIPLTPVFLDIVLPLNESRPHSFGTTVPTRIDQDKYYVPIFCYNASVIVLGIVVMVSVDTMYVVCTAHACALFSIVSKHLEEITSKLDIKKDISEREYRFLKLELPGEQVIYQEYIICLKKYQLALKFVDEFNSTYKIMALVLLLLNGATISLVGVRIVYILDQLKEVMRFGFIIIGILIQLMIICYSGQKLIDESQAVFYRAYAAEWYEFSPRLKSLLITTLYKSTLPCGLTAGNIVPLSMTTYAAVVRTAISYFMTFLSLKN